jgi:PAS domain S-box-containing protein
VRVGQDLARAAKNLGRRLGQFATRQRALRRLAASEAELTDLFGNAPVGIHCADADGRIVLANKAELDMLGWSREEYVGRRFAEFHLDPDVAEELLQRLRHGEQVEGLEARLRCKDGSVRWVRISANAVMRDGEFVQTRAFSRDVTARRLDRERLRQSERRFRTLVEGVRDHALMVLDPLGRVTSWNSGAERLFGFQESELLGREIGETFPEEDRANDVPQRLVRVAADEGEFRHEGWRVRKDGTRFWAETIYTSLRDASGRLEEVTHLVRDLTERRRLEGLRDRSADLEAANRAVVLANRRQEELLRGISETIASPAAALGESAERLRAAAAKGDPPAEADLKSLQASVADLRRTLDRMTEVAVVAANRIEFRPKPVDLLRAAVESRDLLRGPAAERRIRVDVDVDEDLDGVVTDPLRLRQVVYNFLSNAIKFSRERSRVALRILAEGASSFRVEVEDSGPGIQPEAAAAIFKAREPASEESVPGLGLAATKRIVDQQGGRVGVQSTLGRGSVFFAVLPRVLSAEAGAPAAGEEPESRRILVVTEHVANRAGVSWTLGSTGHEVISTESAEMALDVARERRCDVVALDLLLGGTGAVDFTALLRHEGASRALPCVLSWVSAGTAGIAFLPSSDLLPRPAPADRLFGTLERLHVPRTRERPVLVVDEDGDALRSTARALEILGYRAVSESGGDAALKRCAEDPPSAVVLSPFVIGLDPFAFVHHLRRLPGLRTVPLLLTSPRHFSEEQARRLRMGAEAALGEGAGEAARALDGVESACLAAAPAARAT